MSCDGKSCGGKCASGGCGGKGPEKASCASCPNRPTCRGKAPEYTEALLVRLVREAVLEVVGGEVTPTPTVAATPATPVTPAEEPSPAWSRGPKHRKLPPYRHPEKVDALRDATPARLARGRTGARYLTDSYLGLRADHAIAIDAVNSDVGADFAAAQGWLTLQTKAKDKQEYLLHPNQGRRLDDASRARVEKDADRDVDVQLIAGDGLSPVALRTNGPALMKALQAQLAAAGWKVGKPLFVRFARVGVQDEVGVLTKAKCTIILVGERPGLGTGDSLSIYTAFGPKLGQDNSEKDCISNVRAVGFPPEQAAARCVELLKRTFAARGGGVKLT